MLFPVTIKTLYGNSMIVDVEENDTIESIKFQIQDKEGIIPQQQRLSTTNGKKLMDTKRLADYNINKETTLHLAMKLGWSRSIKLSQSTAKTICVKTLNGKCFRLNVEPNDTIKDIKHKIEAKQGIAVDQQRLIFTGQPLMNARKLSDYNIFEGCTLQIVFKLASDTNDVKFSTTIPASEEMKVQHSIFAITKISGKL